MLTEPADLPRHNPLDIEDPIAQQVAELRYLKSQFLASLNHQIRTPMSGILGMVDLLLETQLDSRQKEYVMATRICAQELFDLLSGSLEFSSLAGGNLQLEETEFDLIEVLEAGLMEHALQAESK
jgi:two-component system, sensor histidine kinase and response regulator